MNLACIILNYNDGERASALAKKVESFPSIDEVIIVDNHSTDGSFFRFSSFRSSKISIVETEKNGGYGYGNNYGIRYAEKRFHADLALIVNPDVSFSNDCVDQLRGEFEKEPTIAVVSCIQKTKEGDESPASAWKIPPKSTYICSLLRSSARNLRSFYYSLPLLHRGTRQYVDCVAGSFLLVDIRAFLKFGGYDEGVFLYCEETVLGFRCRDAGKKTLIRSDLSYTHIHGQSIQRTFQNKRERASLLVRSHHYVLKKYYKSGWLSSLLDVLAGYLFIIVSALIA